MQYEFDELNFYDEDISFKDIGVVTTVIDGVIEIIGLDDIVCGEIVFVGQYQVPALILNLEKKNYKRNTFS